MIQATSSCWRSDVIYPELNRDDVLVWQVPLSVTTFRADVEKQLAEQERQRLQRFSNPVSQHYFAETRIVLRKILAHYMDCEPHEIDYRTNAHGKPYLAPQNSLYFNLSHSGDIALIALCREADIGIDIELANAKRDKLRLARRFFHPAEYQAIHGLQEPERSECFFHLWTRKEAFVKAVGTGIGFPLSAFQVNPTQAEMLWVDPSRYAGHAELHDLPLSPPYYASLAILATGLVVQTILWRH